MLTYGQTTHIYPSPKTLFAGVY